MSLNTFFLKTQVIASEGEELFALDLEPDDLHHLHVLRLSAGEHIAVVDADSDYFECRIESLDGQRPMVSICSHSKDWQGLAASKGRVCSIALFQGMPKGDKFETAIRQGTEIGVDMFAPFISERSISRPDAAKGARKQTRWEAIAKSAAMQSGRGSIPDVLAPLSAKEALAALLEFDRVIVFWEECSASSTIASALFFEGAADSDSNGDSKTLRVAVVVGPEGGFSEGEIDKILSAVPQARLCTMGETILRTETAAVVGCALVSYQLGGLGGNA